MITEILDERKKQIFTKKTDSEIIECDKASLSGSVSQRACVFCGSRVVLYPITDALHIVHGPAGCASYTWDIRGALSSGPELHRNSFTTDLKEEDIIHGGEKKLYQSLIELIDYYKPNACFVYATCIAGVIGDDIKAVCKKVSSEKNIPVITVQSEGFKGTKKDGYNIACNALFELIGMDDSKEVGDFSINILGDFNIAGEIWVIKKYYEKLNIQVASTITGDAKIYDIQNAHKAKLNVVQCSGSMTALAKMMEAKYGIPFIRVSYFGIEDMSESLYKVVEFFKSPEIFKKAKDFIRDEINKIMPFINDYRKKLEGKKAAIYVGGAFKAISLVKALRLLGIDTALVGTQTGNKDDYEEIKSVCDDDTVIVDDTNPLELTKFIKEKNVNILIGGVKERPIAYKMGIGFCDHNHERKEILSGFIGMLNFSNEVYKSIMSPVWQFIQGKEEGGGVL